MANKEKAGNGEGQIWQDGKVWRGRISLGSVNGKRVRRKVSGTTKKEVRDKLNDLKRNADGGVVMMSANVTVEAFMREWLDSLSGTVSPRTVETYRSSTERYIIPTLGKLRVTDLAPPHVEAMMRQMANGEVTGKKLSPNTQRLARNALRRALGRAVKHGTLMRNAAALADPPKVASSGETPKQALTPEQAKSLLAYLDAPDPNHVDGERIYRLRSAWVVAMSLGLRLGELLGLTWDDVDLDGGWLGVHHTLVRIEKTDTEPGRLEMSASTKTASSRRRIKLPDPLVAELKAHRKRQNEDCLASVEWEATPLGVDLVFRTSTGTAVDPRNFRSLTYRVTERAGVPRVSPHKFRHTAASLLVAQGVPLEMVSDVLGHTSVAMTADIYTTLFEPMHEKTAEAMTTALWS